MHTDCRSIDERSARRTHIIYVSTFSLHTSVAEARNHSFYIAKFFLSFGMIMIPTVLDIPVLYWTRFLDTGKELIPDFLLNLYEITHVFSFLLGILRIRWP